MEAPPVFVAWLGHKVDQVAEVELEVEVEVMNMINKLAIE